MTKARAERQDSHRASVSDNLRAAVRNCGKYFLACSALSRTLGA